MKKYYFSLVLFLFIQILSINEVLSQSQKGLDLAGIDAFDYAGVVSMPDANTLAIGAPISQGLTGAGPGYARVFEWNGSNWVQKGETLIGEDDRDEFGFAVSMPNSNTLAVGAPSNDETDIDAGHVRIFTWNGTDWIQKGEDIDGLNLGDQSGNAVSMPDENTVAVGARRHDLGGTNSGSASVYEWDGNAWIQKGTTIAGASSEDLFGSCLSMPDANTLAVGAYLNDGNGNASGEVRIFEWNGSDWTQKGTDLLGESAGDLFGRSVSMPNSDFIAVGAIWNSDNGEDAGHVRLFDWDGVSWVQKGNDIDGEEGEQLGFAVSAPTPNVVAVGSNANSTNGVNAGQVKIYEWNGSSWVQKGVAIDGANPGDSFGSFVDMPDPGNFVGGSKLNDDVASDAGHARVYSFCDGPVTGVDVQSACDSYTWIDGETYNSSNNSATWTLTSQEGCDSIVTLNLTIGDNIQPIPDADELENIMSECPIEELIAPTATDNCAGALTGTSDATFPISESTMVTWTYEDGNGNTSFQTQEVFIEDTTAPVVDIEALEDVVAECEVTALIAPTATDNCEGVITGTHDAVLPIIGSTSITWTYADGSGNTSTQIQEIIIEDSTAPMADIESLEDVVSECEVTALIAPTATDNCEGVITGTHDAVFPIIESTSITWTYADGSGNTSTQIQEIIIDAINNGITEIDSATLSADAEGYDYQWIDCNNGNAEIPNATEQIYVASMNGSYAVVVSNGTCSVTSECIEVIIIGVEEELLEGIEIYPNPSNGLLNINSVNGIERVLIMNALGQILNDLPINQESSIQLQLPEESGVYLIRIESNGLTQTSKVVKL